MRREEVRCVCVYAGWRSRGGSRKWGRRKEGGTRVEFKREGEGGGREGGICGTQRLRIMTSPKFLMRTNECRMGGECA